MRFPIVVLLVLLCFSNTLSQSKPIVEDRGNFGLHVVDDWIRRHKYLEEKNQLLIIGNQHLQLLDLSSFKVVETRPLNLPYRDLRSDYNEDDWTISPDGSRMMLLGLYEGRTKTNTENKQTAWVIDLQTEKRIASLNHPDRIRSATWSKNGKTLMTMPRVAVVRNFVLNHNVHHRAQMGVYLRLNDVPVPSVYGPSADEGQMG